MVANIEWALDYFSKCAENRDALMHSRPTFGYREKLPERLSLERRSRNSVAALIRHWHLQDLRSIADEIMSGMFFLMDTVDFVFEQNGIIDPSPLAARALPQKPPLPHIRDHSPEETEASSPQRGSSAE